MSDSPTEKEAKATLIKRTKTPAAHKKIKIIVKKKPPAVKAPAPKAPAAKAPPTTKTAQVKEAPQIKKTEVTEKKEHRDASSTALPGKKTQAQPPAAESAPKKEKKKGPIRFIHPSVRLRNVPGETVQQQNTRKRYPNNTSTEKTTGTIPVEETGKQKVGVRRFMKKAPAGNRSTHFRMKRKESLQAIQEQKPKKVVKRTNPVPSLIEISETISVADLARKMNLKASDLISRLMSMGMMVTINQSIDAETAEILASEYHCKVKIVSLYEETLIASEEDREEDLRPRPPIVTIMGHVDHGKTTLLDVIRKSNVAASEAGAITQHIGAYQVDTEKGSITFLDTPGHEAFTLMRARGAQITDVVVLVVAADDGVKPQTIEALDHIKEAAVPVIVAITKVDLPSADIEKVQQQLSTHNIMSEAWGGHTQFIEVSAKQNQGLQELLEAILLQAELLEIKGNYHCRAEGHIIESMIDPHLGRISTVLVQRGILKISDCFAAGIYPGKVRALINDKGERIKEASPSQPVQVLGFDGIADPGDPFQVTIDERTANQVSQKRQELRSRKAEKVQKKHVTLDNLYESIQESKRTLIKIVIKGDTHGSVEALKLAFEKLNTEEVHVSCIHTASGAVNETDVMLASASSAIIVGFHVRPSNNAAKLAEREEVKIYRFNIIYEAVDAIRAAIEGMSTPETEEQNIGLAEVRKVFQVPKIGKIAGCYVTEGKIIRNAKVRVFRDGEEVYKGNIATLKRFKDDAREVSAGFECGISFAKFHDLQELDQLEVYQIAEKAKE